MRTALLLLAASGTAPRRSALDRALQTIMRAPAGGAAMARAASLGTNFSVVSRGGRGVCVD